MQHERKRARDIGLKLDGAPGPLNAITDVEGVLVGHETIHADFEGDRAARTGVTAIFPREKNFEGGLVAGASVLNGAGEFAGSHVIEEFGALQGPVSLTNTLDLPLVQRAVVDWLVETYPEAVNANARVIPAVLETWDGVLNDIFGRHIQPKHVYKALEAAQSGPVAEGSVGGGAGMMAYQLKAGIGTASRVVDCASQQYSVGVLVQANHGYREALCIQGVPVGRLLKQALPTQGAMSELEGGPGSIVGVIATDAPLLPHQAKRLARRGSLGLGRCGAIAGTGSGDFFLAFSNKSTFSLADSDVTSIDYLPDQLLNPLFEGVVQSVEEAIINALLAGDTTVGNNRNTVYGIDQNALVDVLKSYAPLG